MKYTTRWRHAFLLGVNTRDEGIAKYLVASYGTINSTLIFARLEWLIRATSNVPHAYAT